MVRAGLSIAVVVGLVLPTLAADGSEEGKTPKPSALPVREFLEQAAKSPLGLGEAGLLKAVADLLEKEQVAGVRGAVSTPPTCLVVSTPAVTYRHPRPPEGRPLPTPPVAAAKPAVAPSPTPPIPAPKAGCSAWSPPVAVPPYPSCDPAPTPYRSYAAPPAPYTPPWHPVPIPHPPVAPAYSPPPVAQRPAPEQPKRLVIRLNYAPVVDVAKALGEFLDSEQEVRGTYGHVPNPHRAVLVPEPVSNSLLVSGTPNIVDSLTELIAKLDTRPDTVMVNVCIAEFLPAARDAKTDGKASDDSAAEEPPCMMEHGAAWLAWAKKHRRLEVLSRPQIMTLDNQPALIKIGTTVPAVATKPGKGGPVKGDQIKQTEIGLTVGLTPRISPEGLVVMELEVEDASIATCDGAASPITRKMAARTTISATDGQTVVIGGLMQRTENDCRELIIAVTPHVNPKK